MDIEETQTCPNCGGTGGHIPDEDECGTCQGTRVISAPNLKPEAGLDAAQPPDPESACGCAGLIAITPAKRRTGRRPRNSRAMPPIDRNQLMIELDLTLGAQQGDVSKAVASAIQCPAPGAAAT
ncbi:hypothetical protein [Amycolatopsis magusensis]|uniref:hypothetical protein n=1 Tax=Amycolatopsis magusensis TaxID=882444 RepID=UPI0037A66662